MHCALYVFYEANKDDYYKMIIITCVNIYISLNYDCYNNYYHDYSNNYKKSFNIRKYCLNVQPRTYKSIQLCCNILAAELYAVFNPQQSISCTGVF